MLSRWPIRNKLITCIALLLVIVATLSYGGFRGVYAYRGAVKAVGIRAAELPLASEMARHVSDLRVTLNKTRRIRERYYETGERPIDSQSLREQFRTSLALIKDTLRRYRVQLKVNQQSDQPIGDFHQEREAVRKIDSRLARITELNHDEDWMLDQINVEQLHEELEQLHLLTGELPTYLQQRMESLAHDVRGKYRTWIVLTWVTSAASLLMLILLLKLSYLWVFRPLRVLIKGSRIVAGGAFNYRIQLQTHDEMSELAEAMNAMTARFQEIKADLDCQVRERTMEVVRSEQLASVGVLAAGVAHEINNPLASIAFRAEALEGRLHDILPAEDDQCEQQHDEEIAVLQNYLRTIQEEAFRCKGITDRLLDFSREGNHERQLTDLAELVEGVIDMVRHLGKYREKEIVVNCHQPVFAPVDPQEMKQVVLNLVTNGLEALSAGGTLTIEVRQQAGEVELTVADDGCGMTPEVLSHIFEPFFTSRQDGQGNGLGLAITHRIIKDHGGRIVASSGGPGLGSQIRVTLPIVQHEEESQRKYQAA